MSFYKLSDDSLVSAIFVLVKKIFTKNRSDVHYFLTDFSIRGYTYHAYCRDINVYVGEVMTCEQEPENEHDEHAVVGRKPEVRNWLGMYPLNFQRYLASFGLMVVRQKQNVLEVDTTKEKERIRIASRLQAVE